MLKASIWIVSVILLLGGAAYYFFWLPQEANEPAQPVQLKTIRRTAHGAGLIEGNSTITHLKFAFASRVDSVEAKENDTVAQGDVIARLNPTEINDKIALEEIALKEATAKRDVIVARRKADLVEKKEAELKRAHLEALEAQARLDTLKIPAKATFHLDQQEDAKLAVERAQRALTLAEAEQKLLASYPTPHELEAADARLNRAKFRNDEAKRTGQDAEGAAAELRDALANYDKVKHGASPAEKEVAAARTAQARGELERAETVKRRLDAPQAPPAMPQAEIDLATKLLAEAKAIEDQKRQELDKLRSDADSAETRLVDAAVERSQQIIKSLKNMKLGYELQAPFKCLIVKRLVEPDTLLAPFEDVVWIVDFTKKRVRAEFDIKELPALTKPGLIASVKSRAFGKEELTARVVEINKVGTRKLLQDDPSQPKGGEVVEVVMAIDEPKEADKKALYELLRPGLRVESDIVLESRSNVLSVPKSYVATENGENGHDKMYVMKVDANAKKQKFETAHKQEVICGTRDEYYVEITEGLTVDDLVVKPKAQNK